MSAIGYWRTFSHTLNYVRFTPESGHSEGTHKESAFDPKRTFATGERTMFKLSVSSGTLFNNL